MSATYREGEPLRFSLASPDALSPGLLAHARGVFGSACRDVVESSPRVGSVRAVSLFGRAERDGPLAALDGELRGPALALGVDCALIRGDLAVGGPRLIVSDVDSTFIHGEVIEMLAEVAGSVELVSDITARAMAGELDFAQSLTERVATLRGVPESALADVASGVVAVTGADLLVSAAHANGARVGLVSGGFHEVVDVVGARLGVDDVLANRLEVADGRLTGRVLGPIVTRAAKAEALERWAARHGIALDQTVAMGDGANDLDMMELAGLSIAVMAKQVVLERADAAITHPRLDIAVALFGWDGA
ncbi:MAG: phosphoserine phosphatase SerB [Actinomycetaceae bacterium]|nr:phosphoserine phosphatase SerB [Actinomycetaceae bacterium]